ncbi:hypothetical protein DFH07DRAFT_850323 [Mycena maculata]|uniref:UBC core domain-containing protein n=1 Tax=Mycena maculata TaxID=230809 RepID=A0AAD7HVF8_9AGAR|nr:hypothetical protein DFH07DRAFT_850323 [Mycena maculata]
MASTSKSRPKRPLSPSNTISPTKRARKQSRGEPDEEDIVVVEDDEDDLEIILARIKESEESERLAKKLQSDWGSSSNREIFDVDDDPLEDDAAMARRLAAEWGQETGDSEASEIVPLDVDAWEPPASSAKAGSSRTLSSDADDVPPDQRSTEFRPVFIAERSCSKCGKPVKSPRGFVMFSAATEDGILPPSLVMLLHAPCASCKTNHCRGCFSPIACPISCKGKSKNAQCTVESCCSEVRALAIFECLGGFDRQFLGERATSDSRALALSQQSQPQGASVGPGGTGYGTDGFRGGGYRARGRGRGRGRGAKGSGQPSRVAELAAHWDELVVRALGTLTTILPSPYAESAQVYDMLPHPSIGHLLSLSQLPELLGGLLRNDSVTDWIARSEIYYAMIALLRRMADCELTVQVLIGQRFCMERSSGLEEWMWEDGEISWETDKRGRIERAPPLYDHFKKLTKQSEAFLAGAAQMMEGGEDGDSDMDETIKAMSICGDIIAARDDMERAISILGRGDDSTSTSPSKGEGKGKAREIDMEQAYSQACETLSFKHVELDYSQFNYVGDLKATESATRTPKNRLHLVKELATMATSLPPGIFVRVDEVRNDVIKIMIAGPEDTPYSGGLFEFDCFMPLNYPATPPLMHLRTTGSGTVRFNPNLYNSGKVCLSLLGTWPGRPEEQWSSSSTLLQVLVSIQSMILIDAPYYNEPGHGKANPNAPVSVAYNKEISLQTCRWAIVDWLNAKHQDGIWKDVIASHFTIRKDKIRQKIMQWAAKDPSLRSYRSGPKGGYGYGAGYEVVVGLNGASGKSLDLVNEYDLGITRVQRWIA